MTTVPSTASGIASAVSSGSVSARSVVDAHLERIAARDGDIHAFNLVTADEARAHADGNDFKKREEIISLWRVAGRVADVPLTMVGTTLPEGGRRLYLLLPNRNSASAMIMRSAGRPNAQG